MNPPPAHPLLRLLPWITTAVLTLTLIWLACWNAMIRSERDTLRTERQLAEVASKIAQNRLSERTLLAENMISSLGNKLRRSENLARLQVTVLAPPVGHTGKGQAVVVWDPEPQTGLLAVENLPTPTDTQDYQLWIADPASPDPVNGGVFHVAADGKLVLAFKPDQGVKQAASFAIRLETKGGAAKAGGPVVLFGK